MNGQKPVSLEKDLLKTHPDHIRSGPGPLAPVIVQVFNQIANPKPEPPAKSYEDLLREKKQRPIDPVDLRNFPPDQRDGWRRIMIRAGSDYIEEDGTLRKDGIHHEPKGP